MSKQDNKDSFSLDDWGLFSITGPDSERFLNGQLTNNIEGLLLKSFHLTSRLNRAGRVLFYGYLFKESKDSFFILTPYSFLISFQEDLKKFIIMDDVEVEDSSLLANFCFEIKPRNKGFVGKIMTRFGSCFLEEKRTSKANSMLQKEFDFFYDLPKPDFILDNNLLVNETVLFDESVCLSKGCFVGQETLKKIALNRGAAKKKYFIKNRKSYSREIYKYTD